MKVLIDIFQVSITSFGFKSAFLILWQLMDTKRRYFVAKCDNIDRLEAASRTCIWACCDRKTNPQPRDVLHSAMLDGDVILVFSVNNCHGWHGYAQMITSPNGSTSAASMTWITILMLRLNLCLQCQCVACKFSVKTACRH